MHSNTIRQLTELAELLEGGLVGVSSHRLEFTTVGLKITLTRLASDDTSLKLTKLLPWLELQLIRPMSHPPFLEGYVYDMVRELVGAEIERTPEEAIMVDVERM